MNNFDQIINRQQTNCVKIDLANKVNPLIKEPNAIQLWVADMDFACPKPIISAMKQRLEHPIYGYTTIDDHEYHQAVTEWFKRRYQYNLDINNLYFSNGVVPGLNLLVQLLTKPNDEIIIQTPVYGPFKNCILNNQRVMITNPLINQDNYYTMDLEDLRNKAKTAKMLILCSPHNPTGRVWTKAELISVVEICQQNDLYLISDEIHCDLLRPNITHHMLLTISNYPKIIVMNSISKTFNLAGLGCSNVIIPDQEIGKLYQKHQHAMPNILVKPAVVAAYTLCDQWLSELNNYLTQNFMLTKQYFDDYLPLAKMQVSEGTYLAWVDLSAYGNNVELNKKISSQQVFVETGDYFIADAEGFIRINLATPRSLLVKAYAAIFAALA
jgi:cysteine-S-conjugate beta-lyase